MNIKHLECNHAPAKSPVCEHRNYEIFQEFDYTLARHLTTQTIYKPALKRVKRKVF